MGGLPRKGYELDQIRRESGQPSLTLDGGSLLFKPDVPATPASREAGRIAAAAIVQAYNLMAYDAVGISGQDLEDGVKFLLELRESAKFAWLSANLFDKTNTRPLFRPGVIRQIGKLRVAIVGLTNPPSKTTARNLDYRLRDWRAVMPGVIADLKPAPDFLILLTGYDLDTCRKIAAAWPGIDLIISATGEVNREPELLTPTTLLIQSYRQGEFLGVLSVARQANRQWQENLEALLSRKQEELRRLTEKSERLRNQPGSQERYRQFQTWVRIKANEIEAVEAEIRQRQDQAPATTFQNRFIALSPKIPGQRDVQILVDRTRAKIMANANTHHAGQPQKRPVRKIRPGNRDSLSRRTPDRGKN